MKAELFARSSLAYLVARDLTLAKGKVELETDMLKILLDRIIAEASDLIEVRKLVEANISNCREILAHLEKGLLSLDFCRS